MNIIHTFEILLKKEGETEVKPFKPEPEGDDR